MLFSQREHLLHYMLKGHVHLSKKDYGFFNNLQYIIKNNSRVTSNQNKLFDKLIVKYQRQLKKLGYNIQDLQALEWNASLVESAQEFLQATVFMLGDNICIKAPFDSKFVSKFRNEEDNLFLWNKATKLYIAPYSTHSLKLAKTAVEKFFKDVKYCSSINATLSDLEQYCASDWTPTLRKINGRFYVTAINHYLFQAIKDIELNDDPKTLYELSQHGITISEDIKNQDPLRVFSSSYYVGCDLSDFDNIVKWLNLLNVKHVFTSREIIYNKQISNEIKLKLLDKGITCNVVDVDDKPGVLIRSSNFYNSNINSKKISKMINLTNSRPVDVR